MESCQGMRVQNGKLVDEVNLVAYACGLIVLKNTPIIQTKLGKSHKLEPELEGQLHLIIEYLSKDRMHGTYHHVVDHE